MIRRMGYAAARHQLRLARRALADAATNPSPFWRAMAFYDACWHLTEAEESRATARRGLSAFDPAPEANP